MLKEERYDKILSILEKDGYASAAKLSQMLYVSLPTIRRDLAELSRKNQIIRSHGGAPVRSVRTGAFLFTKIFPVKKKEASVLRSFRI